MTVLAASLAAAAAAVLLGRPRLAVRRLGAPARASAPPRVDPVTAACALGALGLLVLVGPPVGVLLAAAVLLGGPRVLCGLEPRHARDERQRLAADAPMALDLLAACLAGGAVPSAAAAVVAAAVGGPVGARLSSVGAALRVGTSPPDAWALLGGTAEDDPLAPAARVLVRASDGGAPVAAVVGQLAADARRTARARREQAARRVGVLVVAPLGLCFLPAFVLLGVVPVVIGLAGPLLDTL